MKRGIVSGVLAAVVLTALASLAAVAWADSPAVKDVAWWTSSPTPPDVPNGGIGVGQDVSAPNTIAALHVGAKGGVTAATITLTETNGQGQPLGTPPGCAA